MVVAVARSQVVGFRLRAHGLDGRLDRAELAVAAGRCGIQDSPPGSALLALHARVRGVSADRVHRAIADERTLLRTWSVRGAPFLVPTADLPVFTTGVLPTTERAGRRLVLGVGEQLDRLELSLADAVALVEAETGAVLAGRRLAITELGHEVAARVGAKLSVGQRSRWQEPGPWSPGQPVGEGVVHFCLRILTLRRVVCFAPRHDNTAPFALLDEWLPQPIPALDPSAARAELLRRYLRCYGPSTRRHFAEWLGVRAGDTDPWWTPLEPELTEVETAGRAWLLTTDLAALHNASQPLGVRLLPPRDPYTQQRDRALLLDPARHREVWRTVGEPGTVLADGELVGSWRPRTTGRRLVLTMTPFAPVTARQRRAVEREAQQVAALRGAADVQVVVDDSGP